MTRQRSKAERLKDAGRRALNVSTRSGAGSDSARSRRAGSADLNTSLRMGDGLDISDGRMEVPLGNGLTIDSNGRVASTAKLEILVSRLASFTLTSTSMTVVPLDGATNSSIGSGTISIDETNDWFRLGHGSVYLFEALAICYRLQASTAQESVQLRLDRRDNIESVDPVPTAETLYTTPSFILKSNSAGDPYVTIPITWILDLRNDRAPAALQLLGLSTDANADNEYLKDTNIKIERIG